MLFGREEELAQVRALIDLSALTVLVGPAGIGKTTIGRAALASFGPYRETGALASLSWSPLLVFRRLLGAVPPETAEEVAGAVLRAGGSPVLLDDLQWADDATFDVLAQLVGRVPLVATVRSGEERSAFAIDVLTLLGGVRIDVAALGDLDAERLIDVRHPALPAAERKELLVTAAGNALLLEELPSGRGVSPTLVGVLATRVASLDPDGAVAVERLAVLGRPASGALLGAGTDAAVAAGLAVPRDGLFAIRHGLLAEVIVDGLGARAADVRRELAALVDDAEAAYLLLAIGDEVQARERALRAAETAGRRQRAQLLELAIHCAPDLDAANRVTAARLFTATNQPARARALCEVEGIDGLDAVLRGALRGAAAEVAWLQDRRDDYSALLELAIGDLRGTRTPEEVLVLAGSTIIQTYVELDGRPALARAREAVALADDIGQEQAYAKSRLASVLLTAGEPGWAEAFGDVITAARAAGDEAHRLMALLSLVLGRWVTGDPGEAEALALAEVGSGLGAGLGPEAEGTSHLTLTAYAALLGLIQGRDRRGLVRDFLPTLERQPVFRGRPFLEASLIIAHADAGHHDDAAALADGTVARAGPDPQWRSIALWGAVEAAWLAGRDDEALRSLDDLLELGVGDYPSALQARLVGAHIARRSGQVPAGPTPVPMLPAWQAAPVEWGAVGDAVAGRTDAAVAGFVQAAAAWAPTDVRSEVRCRWAAGDVALRAEHADARSLLAHAAARADGVGCAVIGEWSRRLLAELEVHGGAGSPRTQRLTPREIDVLRLVGEGMTSAEIAGSLGIATGTVDSMIRTATRKLGVTTRMAAAARLAQRGPG